MDSVSQKSSISTNRIGFHYFPDTTHYSEKELNYWLPEFQALHASWLVLQADRSRAVPENYIRNLLQYSISPVIQVNLDLRQLSSPEELRPVINAYSHWGVKHVQFFARPNDSSSWSASSWAQQDLVDRFLDIYLPYALMTLENGMQPVFPPLKPGGSYWDTAFLRTALEAMHRRKLTHLLSKLILSAYACTQGHPLDWGAGGPEKWPGAKPYVTPGNSEDHRGFHIADWYLSISRSVLGDELPIILLNAGQILPPGGSDHTPPANETYPETCKKIVKIISRKDAAKDNQDDLEPEIPLSEKVIACCFSPLVTQDDDQSETGWYKADGTRQPLVSEFLAMLPKEEQETLKSEVFRPIEPVTQPKISQESFHPIGHYLLLPTYEWGVADWHLDVIKPFVKKHKPVVGFSLEEALMAKQVTVIGNPQVFPEEELDALRQNGCLVERISGDGTTIATQLSER